MKYKNYISLPVFSYAEKLYYGGVEGVSEIPDIEAPTLEEYENLFHQAVDDYIRSRNAAKPATKIGWLITVLVIVVLLLSMVISCPKKAQHTDVLAEMLVDVFNDEADDDDILLELSSLFGVSVSKYLIENHVDVKYYILFSVGEFEYEGKTNVVSIGVLGHVFTASKERVRKEIKESGLFGEL
jgi:hypothetical protein